MRTVKIEVNEMVRLELPCGTCVGYFKSLNLLPDDPPRKGVYRHDGAGTVEVSPPRLGEFGNVELVFKVHERETNQGGKA